MPFGRVPLVLAMLLAGGIGPAHADPVRVPQVPVLTPALQSHLAALDQAIDVRTDQLAAQTAPFHPRTGPYSAQFMLELVMDLPPGTTVGIYDPGAAAPALCPVFTAPLSTGGFALLDFRPAPARVTVRMFDVDATLRESHTCPGLLPRTFAFYLQGPAGTFYMEDARNPGGAAQVLQFAADGIWYDDRWLAFEDRPVGAGSDQGYDDVLFALHCASCVPDPARRRSWGALKGPYR